MVDVLVNFAIDQAGHQNRLVCGTVNFFAGWAINEDRSDPVSDVTFWVGGESIGKLPIRMERPDWRPHVADAIVGFSGPVDIPTRHYGQTLRVEAKLNSGKSIFLQEFLLDNKLTEAEKIFRRDNRLPGDLLIHLVVHKVDPQAFLAEGKAGAQLLGDIVNAAGASLPSVHAILDFGVGCGRIFRWLTDVFGGAVDFHGCDINDKLVTWCQQHLGFGKFAVNGLLPPLPYANSSFNLVYAFSVFTHLDFGTQELWLAEFQRVVAKNGFVVVSTHSERQASRLPQSALQEYREAGRCILSRHAEGENMCATYQTQKFSVPLFEKYFKVISYLPESLHSCGDQDLYVLQRVN